MNNLWSKRLKHWLKEIGKYARLILNDHFSIFVVIILSFLGLYYRELILFLQLNYSEPTPGWFYLVMGILMLLILKVGSPLWLTLAPDASYLYPQGAHWRHYWTKGILVGMILPIVVSCVVLVVMYPIIATVTPYTISQWPILLILVISFRFIQAMTNYLTTYRLGLARWTTSPSRWIQVMLSIIFTWGIIHPTNGMLVIVLCLVILILLAADCRNVSSSWPQFDTVVDLERQRQAQFYRWVSIFADVPQLVPPIRYNYWLERLMRPIDGLKTSPYHLIFSRALTRNGAYSSVWLRVMIFFAILILCSHSFLMQLALGLVSHLLTSIQLVNLLTRYETHPMMLLYPKDGLIMNPLPAFQTCLFYILLIQSLVYQLSAYLTHSSHSWLLLPIWLFAGWVWNRWYASWWYQRHLRRSRVK